MIGAVMPGCDAFHASASCDGVQPFSLRERDEPLDHVERGGRRRPAEVVLAAVPTAGRALVVAPILARQQSAAQRRPRDQRKPETSARRGSPRARPCGRAGCTPSARRRSDSGRTPSRPTTPRRSSTPGTCSCRCSAPCLDGSDRRARAASRRSECRPAGDAVGRDRSNRSAGACSDASHASMRWRRLKPRAFGSF